MTIRTLVVVGHGRMGAALRRSLRPAYPGPGWLSGHEVSAGGVHRPVRGPVTWVLAVPDGALPPVVTGLLPALAARDVVLHLAGMLGPEVLSPARDRGASVGSMHPLAAVASARARTSLAGTSFTFEGDPAARAEARRMATALAGRLLVGSTVDRARYHGAAALVATGGVALAQGAAWMLSGALTPAPSEEDVRAAVASLLRSVARNVEAVGVERALASPLLRNDTSALARHLTAMEGDSTVQAVYRAAIATVLGPLARDKTVDPETLARARALLGG